MAILKFRPVLQALMYYGLFTATMLAIFSYSAALLGAISLVVLSIYILIFKLKTEKVKLA